MQPDTTIDLKWDDPTEIEEPTELRTRAHAGERLAKLLNWDAEVRPMVLGVPGGGVLVGSPIARQLGVPLGLAEALPPGRQRRREVASTRTRAKPGQQRSLTSTASGASPRLHGGLDFGANLPSVIGRTVVLVDDGLHSSVGILELMKALRLRGALRVVFMVPFVELEDERRYLTEASECIAIKRMADVGDPKSWYTITESPSVEELQALLSSVANESPGTPGFSQILLATDYSDNAMRAAAFASLLVPESGTLEVLHILPASSDSEGLMSIQHEGETLEAVYEQVLPENLSTQYRVEVGDPGKKIIQRAVNGCHDLIVMGTHGKRGLQRLLVGSVSATVVRDSPIPVLVVPS